jgi:hypothetical protein
VSIGHVVATAGNLKSKLKTSEIKQEISTVADSCNDDQILHAAIRILRRLVIWQQDKYLGCVQEDNQDTFEVIVSLEKPVYALLGLREVKRKRLKKIEN